MSGSSRAYRLSPRAEIDLEDIWLYTLERWSAEQADRYQNEIISALEALTKGDESGRRVISARLLQISDRVAFHFCAYPTGAST